MKLTQKEMEYIESFKKSDQVSTSIVIENVKPNFEIKGEQERILADRLAEKERLVSEKKEQLLLEHQEVERANQNERDRIERQRLEEIINTRRAEELKIAKIRAEEEIINEVAVQLQILENENTLEKREDIRRQQLLKLEQIEEQALSKRRKNKVFKVKKRLLEKQLAEAKKKIKVEEETVEEEEEEILPLITDDEMSRLEDAASKKIHYLYEAPQSVPLPQQSWDPNAYRQRLQFITAKSREEAYRQEKFQDPIPYTKGAGGVSQTSEWGPARTGNRNVFESGDGSTLLFNCYGKRASSLSEVTYDCGTGFLLDLRGRPKVRHM